MNDLNKEIKVCLACAGDPGASHICRDKRHVAELIDKPVVVILKQVRYRLSKVCKNCNGSGFFTGPVYEMIPSTGGPIVRTQVCGFCGGRGSIPTDDIYLEEIL